MKSEELTTDSNLIDFEHAELIVGINPNEAPMLVVSGTRPSSNMDVVLESLQYIRQPEYWTVKVKGIIPEGDHHEKQPSFAEELKPAPLGTEGVEVVGASKKGKLTYPIK